MATERWLKKVLFVIHEENDGPRALRKGLEKVDEPVDGSERSAWDVKPQELAKALKSQLKNWPAGWWETFVTELRKE